MALAGGHARAGTTWLAAAGTAPAAALLLSFCLRDGLMEHHDEPLPAGRLVRVDGEEGVGQHNLVVIVFIFLILILLLHLGWWSTTASRSTDLWQRRWREHDPLHVAWVPKYDRRA